MTSARELYGDLEEYGSFYGPGIYQPILDDLGNIVVQYDESAYQGDSFLLYQGGSNWYGILIFGWGSCSGCDALQACNSYEEIDSLRDHLKNQIRWDTLQGTLDYLENHDWEGDYSWNSSECQEFVEAAKKLLREKL